MKELKGIPGAPGIAQGPVVLYRKETGGTAQRSLEEAAALDGARSVAKGETAVMAPVLKGLRLPVTGLGDVKQCQVHRGGVSVRAVDDRTCEVRRVPGLYVVGEALDVDAACGGFNLHWAWASGLLAGWSAAERLRA